MSKLKEKSEAKIVDLAHNLSKVITDEQTVFTATATDSEGNITTKEFSSLDYAGSAGIAEDAAELWLEQNHVDPDVSEWRTVSLLPKGQGYKLKHRFKEQLIEETFLTTDHGNSLKKAKKSAEEHAFLLDKFPTLYRKIPAAREKNYKYNRGSSQVEEHSEHNLSYNSRARCFQGRVHVRTDVMSPEKVVTKTFPISRYGNSIEEAKNAGKAWQRFMIVNMQKIMFAQIQKIAQGKTMPEIREERKQKAKDLQERIEDLKAELELYKY